MSNAALITRLAKIEAQLRMHAIQPGVGYDFTRSSGGTALTIKPQPAAGVASFRPFKVYQATNIVDPTQSFRTFQMRSGFIGVRPKYNWQPPQIPNWHSMLQVQDGTDGNFSNDFDAPTNLNGATMTQIIVPASGDVLLTAAPVQFVLDDTGFEDLTRGASVYIKITDDPIDGISFATSVKMYGTTDSALVPDYSSDTILVATIFPEFPGTPALGWGVEQVLYNHALDRFGAGQMTYRGNWTIEDLTAQVFYPGDVVSYGDYSAVEIINSFVKTGQNVQGSADPKLDQPDWQPIAWNPPP